jgi:putative transposase
VPYNPQIHHRRSVRLKGYDYAQAGAYFVTICTHEKECLFGHVENDEMILNETGKIAYNEWLRTPLLRPNVSLDVFEIMPNHMHGIIIINDFPIIHSDELNSPRELKPAFRSPSKTVGSIVRGYKSTVSSQINARGVEDSVWQRDYHEHIIRNEKSYQHISDYIVNNPKNWRQDKFYR